MKILFAIKAINRTKGGSERVLADVTDALARRGHDISLMTFDGDEGDTFYPLSPAIRRIPLGEDDAMHPAGFAETLKRIAKIRKTLLRERPDLIVAFMHSMFVPAAFANMGLGIPLIASEHIVRDHYTGRKFEFFLFLLSSFYIDAYTVLSEAVRRAYPFFIRRKMHVVPNPVNVASLFADPGGATASSKTILTVGRLEAQKRQDILIEAFASLAADYPDWVLDIVGEGSLKAFLQKQIERLSLSGRVRLLPPTQQIEIVYASAQIFALPSAYESFGLATAEAMAHGLPAIGFADCPGTNELIDHGHNGLLAEADNDEGSRIQSFSRSLKLLMDSPQEREAMGRQAKMTATRFSIDAIADHWEKLISKTFKNHRG